jgi:hypothetical protein
MARPRGRPRSAPAEKQGSVLSFKATREFFTRVAHQAALRNMKVSDFMRTALNEYMAVPAQPHTITKGPLGQQRQQIVDLLRDHPNGLSPAQTRQLLGVEKDLGSTMKAMCRDGLIVRLAPGLYSLPGQKEH